MESNFLKFKSAAPQFCLQFFTSSSGTISSFNYKDVAAPRQLNNQNYNLCFRNNLVNNQVRICFRISSKIILIFHFNSIIMGQLSSSFCVSPCTVTTGGAPNAFILSSEVPGSSTLAVSCLADFLIFVGGTSGTSQADRYCGERFSPVSPVVTANAASVCSKFRKAEIHFNCRYTNLI